MYRKRILVFILIILSGVLFRMPFLQASDTVNQKEIRALKKLCFRIKVVDEQAGRGVPLIELKTTNLISYFTDSNGLIAIYEPGLMDQEVFFHISGHGYEYPKDGFGFRGKRIIIKPGGSLTIKVERINIAERLYRITGQGIYRDSIILGDSVPLANPVINGLVMGQDSIQTCWYKDKLYWFWGDTGRPSYPLGHFAMAGAISRLPAQGGLDPSQGVDLQYFTDDSGFSKKMAPMSEPGMIWLDGFFTVEDSDGEQHMLAVFARMKSLAEPSERGLIPIYWMATSGGRLLSREASDGTSQSPLFYGVPIASTEDSNEGVLVPLYEYTNSKTGAKRYSVEDTKETGWQKGSGPLCLVWSNPTDTLLVDWEAQPWRRF
jgi:hypothetical protein